MKILRYLNGKKTVIGAVSATLIGFSQSKGWLMADEAQLCLTLNSLLIGVGVTHKVQKFQKQKKESK